LLVCRLNIVLLSTGAQARGAGRKSIANNCYDNHTENEFCTVNCWFIYTNREISSLIRVHTLTVPKDLRLHRPVVSQHGRSVVKTLRVSALLRYLRQEVVGSTWSPHAAQHGWCQRFQAE
jgi:hypothetical protein